MVLQGKMTKDLADWAFEEAEGNLESWEDLRVWAAENSVPYELYIHEGIVETKPEPQSWAFATKVLPRFQEMLRCELAAEAACPIDR